MNKGIYSKKFCVLFTFAITALTCSITANHSCSFVELKTFTSPYSIENELIVIDDNDVTVDSTEFGIWKGYSSDQKCDTYPSDVYIDSYWKTSRTFSLIGDMLSISISILLVLSRVTRFNSCKLMTALSFLCCFLQGCTFFMLTGSACEANRSVAELDTVGSTIITKGECWFSTGAKYDIAAVTFWLAVAIILTEELTSPENDDDSVFSHADRKRYEDGENIALKRMS